MAAAALIAGGAIGAVVIAPHLRGTGARASAAAAATDKKIEPPRMVRIDNVIVNPAGTQGQHYLIVSIAIEVNTADAENRLKQADVPMRDAITGILERKTMDQLTQLGARDSLRAALLHTAIGFAGDSAVKIYLPQFLIQ